MCRFVIFLLSSIAKAVRLVAIIFLTVRGSRHGGIDGYRRCTGIIFNTRVVAGCVVVCGVNWEVSTLLLWVYFCLPASERGVCGVGSGDFFPILRVDFFSTRVMRGLLQFMSIFASFVRVLFLILVWLWGACFVRWGRTDAP